VVDASSVAILKLATSRLEGIGLPISERTTTRRVAKSEAAPMELMRALRFGLAQRKP